MVHREEYDEKIAYYEKTIDTLMKKVSMLGDNYLSEVKDKEE